MTKYELSLTKDYVPGWTLTDAMRELFQNAIDQETTNPDNTMFWEYHEDVESFHIGNKLSVLEPKSLLLGASTKTDDPNTIGKFGEGYKIATLVLLRLGYNVTFFNYGAKEVWRARFSKSRKYGEEILVFEVDKKFPWAAVPNNNLTIVVEGISLEDSLEIGSTNLHMQEGYDYWKSPKGRILLDEDLKGKMFVNGLYICEVDKFAYGYDFKPDAVKLDRDRSLIRDFDLKWTTSEMWAGFDDTNEDWDHEAIEAASSMIASGAPDVEFLQYNSMERSKYKAVAKRTYESFKDEYGDNAVPVIDNDELNAVPSTHKPIVVNEGHAKAIKSSPDYSEPKYVSKPTLQERLKARLIEWEDTWGEDVPHAAIDALHNIVDEECDD